jgi:hypothetical protein
VSCDHVIGLVAPPLDEPELVKESERDQVGAERLASIRRWLDRGLGGPSAIRHALALDTPAKALADCMDAFAYCPRCGAALWPADPPA